MLLTYIYVHAGYEIIISSGVGLHGMARVEGLEKVTRSRSMLGNSGGDTEEDVDSNKNDNVEGTSTALWIVQIYS
ncbi:hypothetical protein HRI_004283700 [Hibiscus trionum]|uniref:Uncharacterized protein n=1 Tax=Hibiscus trionum TaxID=183268 RepID=A0A9W7MNR2_HIBTR|nr:hypothetical protein HRI_004283700 [Hibiscus trionum]